MSKMLVNHPYLTGSMTRLNGLSITGVLVGKSTDVLVRAHLWYDRTAKGTRRRCAMLDR